MKKPSTKQVRAHSLALRKAAREHEKLSAYNRGHAAGREVELRAMQDQLQPTKLKAMQEATALVTACHKLLYSLGLIVNEHQGFGKSSSSVIFHRGNHEADR